MGTWFLAEVWRQYKNINKILIVLHKRNVSIIVDLLQSNSSHKLTHFIFDKGMKGLSFL